MQLKSKKIIILLGPTASGKTNMAIRLAQETQGEIISVDSRQVFCGMDIGTGKDKASYGNTPVHLIDILQPSQRFSVASFQEQALSLIEVLHTKQTLPILCGGSAYYIKALVQNYTFLASTKVPLHIERMADLPLEELKKEALLLNIDVQEIDKVDTARRLFNTIVRFIQKKEGTSYKTNPNRFNEIEYKIFYVNIEREEQRKRIIARLHARIEEGLIEEVQSLLQRFAVNEIEAYGLEYRWVSRYLNGKMSKDAMITKLATEICRFAKRQNTFLRYMQKENIVLFPVTDTAQFLHSARQFLQT